MAKRIGKVKMARQRKSACQGWIAESSDVGVGVRDSRSPNRDVVRQIGYLTIHIQTSIIFVKREGKGTLLGVLIRIRAVLHRSVVFFGLPQRVHFTSKERNS
jgi:hypothetical protein